MGESNTYKMYRTPQDGALQGIPATKRMKSLQEFPTTTLQEIPTTTLQEIPTTTLQEIPTTSCRKFLQEIDKHIPNKKMIDKESIKTIHPSELLEEEAKVFKNGTTSVKQLLQQGRTEEWIFTAISLFEKKKKKKSEGMGLFFLPSFCEEVDLTIQTKEEEQEFQQLLNQPVQEAPEKNPAQNKRVVEVIPKPRKVDFIDMNKL